MQPNVKRVCRAMALILTVLFMSSDSAGGAKLMDDTFKLRQYRLPLPQPFDVSESLKDYGTGQPGAHHDESWPVLYILTNTKNKTAYIGETTNYQRRMKQHSSNPDKDFDRTLLIDNPTFNQSTTFDFENRLIELFYADENFRLTNANNGHSQFDYFNRPQYRQSFRKLWQKLREENFAIHPIEELENTDLFKFSPYKTLTPDQYEAIDTIFKQLEREKNDADHAHVENFRFNRQVTVVKGCPGTGKTILAISLLFKIKNEPKLKGIRVGFVTPMSSLRRTLRKLARLLPGLKPGDILTPSEVTKQDRFDILLVDEAHRLGSSLSTGAGIKAFYNTCDRLGLPHSANQVDWILSRCDKCYLFYDPKQQIRASGLSKDDLDRRINNLTELGVLTDEFNLSTQMRVRGGDEYLDFAYDLLTNKAYMHQGMEFDALFSSKPYDTRKGDPESKVPRYQFAIVDRFKDFCALQQQKEREAGLSRMVAGYAWKWNSKKNATALDIEIEGIKKRWNTSQEDWVNSVDAVHEVGCIHTIQGYDLNYGFVILGPDIYYDEKVHQVKARKSSLFDSVSKRGASDEEIAQIVVNAYYVLMTRGMLGTFLYVCDPALKRYLSHYITMI